MLAMMLGGGGTEFSYGDTWSIMILLGFSFIMIRQHTFESGHFWDPCLATYYPWMSINGIYKSPYPLSSEECKALFMDNLTPEALSGDSAALASAKKMMVHTMSVLVRLEGAFALALIIGSLVAMTQPLDCRWQTHLMITVFCAVACVIEGNHGDLLIGRWFGNNDLVLSDESYKPHGSKTHSMHLNQCMSIQWGITAVCHFISFISALVEMHFERENIEKMWRYIEKVREAKIKAKLRQQSQTQAKAQAQIDNDETSAPQDENEVAASAAGKTKVE